MLSDLELEQTYRSDRHHIGRDFLSPVLSQAASYDRAVGYFTSSALAESSRGLGKFVAGGGKMRIIASPYLSVEDARAIQNGYESRDQVVSRALQRTLSEPMPDPERAAVRCLAWLVTQERLDIKIALLQNQQNVGLYHEKIGVLRDSQGNTVVFTGSANESVGGLLINFESIEVYRSWHSEDRKRVEAKIHDFEALWSNTTNALSVVPFPEAARDALIRLADNTRNPVAFDPDGNPVEKLIVAEPLPGLPRIPSDLEIRQYQNDAVTRWFEARLRGTFRMATGTGKTITALTLIAELTSKLRRVTSPRPLFVLVLCPYQHLVEQWAETARRFGIEPIRCYLGRDYWLNRLSSQLTAIVAGEPFAMAIATYATFQTDIFQRELQVVENNTLLIADEMHNAGSPATWAALPAKAPYRLGLSATPERWHDDEGTAALFSYFGEPVFELDLDEAIRIGALTPYLYFPIVVELNSDEMADYAALTDQIARMLNGKPPSEDMNEHAKLLLIKRSRILANASGKIPALQQAIEPFRNTTYNLVYCGDGSIRHDGESETFEMKRQIDLVVKMLGHRLGMKVQRYTSETPIHLRTRTLDEFASGSLQAVVAIRCLDEGVDIPTTQRAFLLASSTNPRQFIQRRGRILRRAPGKERAELFDFIAVPPANGLSEEGFNMERRLVRSELRRVIEFAELAINGPEALSKLLELRQRYNLMDIGFNTSGASENDN